MGAPGIRPATGSNGSTSPRYRSGARTSTTASPGSNWVPKGNSQVFGTAPGSGLVGWVKSSGRSPVAYLQPCHGPAAYANPGFRTLLSNAIGWVASDDARNWAKANPFPLR